MCVFTIHHNTSLPLSLSLSACSSAWTTFWPCGICVAFHKCSTDQLLGNLWITAPGSACNGLEEEGTSRSFDVESLTTVPQRMLKKKKKNSLQTNKPSQPACFGITRGAGGGGGHIHQSAGDQMDPKCSVITRKRPDNHSRRTGSCTGQGKSIVVHWTTAQAKLKLRFWWSSLGFFLGFPMPYLIVSLSTIPDVFLFFFNTVQNQRHDNRKNNWPWPFHSWDTAVSKKCFFLLLCLCSAFTMYIF